MAHRISRGRAPEKLLERIINGFFNFDWFENKRYIEVGGALSEMGGALSEVGGVSLSGMGGAFK